MMGSRNNKPGKEQTGMDVDEVFSRLRKMAAADPEVRRALLAAGKAKEPLRAFCEYSRSCGMPIYEMDIMEYGESCYAAMKRSTNGGGENSPLLEVQDDYFDMFMAGLQMMEGEN